MVRTAYYTPSRHRRWPLVAVIVALLLALAVLAMAHRPVPAPPTVVAGAIALGTTSIALPCRKVASVMYADGGTILVAIEDSQHALRYLTLELDGSVRVGDRLPGKGEPIDREQGMAIAYWALAAGAAESTGDSTSRANCRDYLDIAFPRNYRRLLAALGLDTGRAGLVR